MENYYGNESAQTKNFCLGFTINLIINKTNQGLDFKEYLSLIRKAFSILDSH